MAASICPPAIPPACPTLPEHDALSLATLTSKPIPEDEDDVATQHCSTVSVTSNTPTV